ncbi:MAG: hypothetical protein IPM97_01410 [Bdellovibrionaceae bacterium]|nr:hypothetical protein [Pseudobdellovibrionaceae bacterium]
MKKLIFTIALVASQHTFAGSTDIWEGSGALFDLQGTETGKYDLVVENSKNGSQIQSNVTVTLPDGTTQKHQCLLTGTGQKGWKSECDNSDSIGAGNGGGQCFGEGLCISYDEHSTGKSYATTIIMDGSTDMRLLRTEVQNGKAVRFFREKLHKR